MSGSAAAPSSGRRADPLLEPMGEFTGHALPRILDHAAAELGLWNGDLQVGPRAQIPVRAVVGLSRLRIVAIAGP
ncbi:MAG: hypothetical protein JO039_01255 [Solirubrobacterales bacterium]|nr:hypothetical protein [Solirubrobacterales bacterium]